MNCKEAQALVEPYLEKKLSLEQSMELVRHIEDCEACREELGFYLVVMIATGMVEEEEHSTDYKEAVRVLLEKTEKEYYAQARYKKRRKLRLIFALFVMLIGLSVHMGSTPVKKQQDTVLLLAAAGVDAHGEAAAMDIGIRLQAAGAKEENTRKDYLFGLCGRDLKTASVLKEKGRVMYPVPEEFYRFAVAGEYHGKPEESYEYTIDLRHGYVQK